MLRARSRGTPTQPRVGVALALGEVIAPIVCASLAVTYGMCRLLAQASTLPPEDPHRVSVTKAVAVLEKAFPLLTTCVTFALGFYMSTGYGRWWKLRDLAGAVLGRSIDTMVMLCTYLNGMDDRSREGRRTLARYLLMAHVVSLQAGHKDTSLEPLCELGLLDKDGGEHKALEQAKTARYNIVCAQRARARRVERGGLPCA